MNGKQNRDIVKLENLPVNDETANKPKTRGKKRKRQDSESSTDVEDAFPANVLEMEKNLHASAIKNNLDDVSVKKILKKVVTNDHVLALVKLREEEENSNAEEKMLQPKLTRSKFKELMKVSPKSGPWNLELTPIKHIPVKTRPEVKALIAQELPEDEDDEEYEPTHEDVPSDDDQGLESCSDLESQPRTPATPSSQHIDSPSILKDGPFKVPQNLSTPARKKLILEEEATIALRTRSKLSLSSTSIEHIESSFVPPDDIPPPVADDPVWNQFLNECLNPTSVSRNEEEDDDPEYNVAADPDAPDEDDEALEKDVFKISKKELNDIVTELFSIMPEATADDVLAENLANDVLTDGVRTEVPSHWDGKQEPLSDEETDKRAERVTRSTKRMSIGKTEPADDEVQQTNVYGNQNLSQIQIISRDQATSPPPPPRTVKISIMEENHSITPSSRLEPSTLPLLLRDRQAPQTDHLIIDLDKPPCVVPTQVLLIQQQLRQHIQLATSNFLQLYVHPIHWNMAHTYREYLEHFNKVADANSKSVVNVCNLRPALELVESWAKCVSEDTPENKKYVEFVQSEAERSRRRTAKNSLYKGNFHDTFLNVVANSSVFLYPYLLPAMPYRADHSRKFGYRRSEDALITLGLEQFWQYVDDNPELYKPPPRPQRQRWGLSTVLQLITKHMFPWLSPRWLLGHVCKTRKEKDTDNPIHTFFAKGVTEPVKHKLLPFNPDITLYEQPEHEMPRIWVRYLAKSSKRFRDHLYRRKNSGLAPNGIEVDIDSSVTTPKKNPLPISFIKPVVSTRINVLDPAALADNFDARNNTNVNTAPPAGFVVVRKDENTGTTTVLGNLIPINNFNTHNSHINVPDNGAVKPNASENDSVPNSVITQSGNRITDNVILINKTTKAAANPMININPNQNKHIKNNSTENSAANNVVNVASENMPANTASSIITVNPKGPQVLTPNMFRVIHTTAGSFLVPFTFETNTVNSIDTPVPTAIETTQSATKPNEILEPEKELTEQMNMKNHCQCCIVIKKICKEKQSLITDFFKVEPGKEEKKCPCNEKRYPNITKRLRMLVKNYKSKSWCVYRDIQLRLNKARDEQKNYNEEEIKPITSKDESYSLEDIAFVMSYQLKVNRRVQIARNKNLKKAINGIFSKFDPDFDDPIKLSEQLEKAFNIELVDVYKEFMSFLTAEQADKADKFKDYFIYNCVSKLAKKVEETEMSKELRTKILTNLEGLLIDNRSTSCEMCFKLLNGLEDCPKLARYIFSLFPHRSGVQAKEKKSKTIPISSQTKKTTSDDAKLRKADQPERILINIMPKEADNAKLINEIDPLGGDLTACNHSKPDDQPEREQTINSTADEANNREQLKDEVDPLEGDLTICEEAEPMDYETDYSSCEPDCDRESVTELTNITSEDIKAEDHPENEVDAPELTISKPKIQTYESVCPKTNMSTLTVVIEDEPVKVEAPEWKREHDKQILEVLMQYLNPNERKDKTILEIIEEKNIYQILSESLTDKTIAEIKQRVIYLLEILVLSNL